MDDISKEARIINERNIGQGKQNQQYYCRECLWFSEFDIAMKSECPYCTSTLHLIRGSEEELIEFRRLKLGD